jgi:hypothetical protein
MGLVAERTTNMDLENFNVKLRNGSNRIISSTADATHFVNCRGDINITNCTFENMLDDGTNFHSVYGRVAGLEGRKKIGVRLVHYQQYGFDFADIGDSVRIIDPKSFYPIFSSKVESINKLNESYFEITLKDFLPKNISIDDAIENLSWHPENVDISHCIVKQNRARGFLINTRGKFEIRNNYFATMMEGVQISSGLGFFSEAGSVDDVLIENNIFDNCSNSGYGNAVININPHIEEFIPEQDYYHPNNIRIIGNTINHFDNLILNVFHSNHVLFKNNQINKTAKYPPLFLDNPTIKMSHCKDAKVCGNKFIGFDYKLEATVEQSVNVHLQSSIKHKQ